MWSRLCVWVVSVNGVPLHPSVPAPPPWGCLPLCRWRAGWRKPMAAWWPGTRSCGWTTTTCAMSVRSTLQASSRWARQAHTPEGSPTTPPYRAVPPDPHTKQGSPTPYRPPSPPHPTGLPHHPEGSPTSPQRAVPHPWGITMPKTFA